jgi:hypothetical protein
VAGPLSISDFLLHRGVKLHARVTWDPANPGASAKAEMTGTDAAGNSWTDINGGIAFLNVLRGDGASLRLETWGTDTNGDYSAAAIDIFTLPIDLTGPFPPALANLRVLSPHKIWTYVITSIPGEPNGFNLDAGKGAP